MALSQTTVLKLYNSVIEDVISGVREAFLDEGVDDQVLQELKQLWEMKLHSNKAVEPNPEPEPAPPQLGQKSNSKSGVLLGAGSSNGTMIQNQSGVLAGAQNSNNISQTMTPAQQQNHLNQLNRQQQQTLVVRNQVIQPPQQQTAPTLPTPTSQQQTQLAAAAHAVLAADPNRQVPIQITLPAQQGVPDAQPRVLTIQVPASALTGNQLQQVLTGPVISATMSLPLPIACSLLQQHVNAALQGQAASAAVHMQSTSVNAANTNVQNFAQGQANNAISQLDGAGDTSDEDEDDDDDDDDIDDDEENFERDEDENDENEGGAEEEPLNSGDDVSDEDPTDLFDTENVVVCQYDKITRSRNKWKFYLKDGIMNLNGKDFVFQRANGDAEW